MVHDGTPRRPRPRAGVDEALAAGMGRAILPCLLAIGVVTAVAVVQPVLAFLVLFGLPVLAYGVNHPKRFAGLGLLVGLFGKSLGELTDLPGLGFADEAMVGGILLVGLLRRVVVDRERPRGFPGLVFFAGYALLGVLGDLMAHVPVGVTLSGTTLAVKGPLLALGLAQVHWTSADLRRFARAGVVIIAVMIVTSLVNLAVPGVWQGLLGNSEKLSYRSAIPSLIGPFTHPGELGPMAAFAFLAVVAWNTAMGARGSTRFLSGALAVVAVLAFRRKTWLGMAATYLWLSGRAKRPGLLIGAVLAIATVATVFASTLAKALGGLVTTYVDQAEGTAARTVMTRDSFGVALEHFPLGAGFGRFGSETAGEYFSPEYLERGYQHIWGLSAELGNDRYLNDTMWPAILGEAGYFGLVAFLLALFAVYRALRPVSASDVPIVRWFGLTGLAWLLQYLVESSGTQVFVSPPVYVPLFAMIGISASFVTARTRPATSGRRGAGRSRSGRQPVTVPAGGGRDEGATDRDVLLVEPRTRRSRPPRVGAAPGSGARSPDGVVARRLRPPAPVRPLT